MIPNQTDIIKCCLKGQEKAFRQLYDAFAPRMLGVCRRYARETAEAEDLLQEGFMKIYEQLSDFKSNGSLEGWIYRIIVNNAIDNFRKNHKMQTFEMSEIHEDNLPFIDADEILSKIYNNELLEIINQLPRQYGFVFNLYVFEGYKYHEIAEKLKISEGTVKSNLFDARKLLKVQIIKTLDMKDIYTRKKNESNTGK